LVVIQTEVSFIALDQTVLILDSSVLNLS
jgi:hypothetical protein